jgi:hypothetical protein
VRLASKLTGYELDIAPEIAPAAQSPDVPVPAPEAAPGATTSVKSVAPKLKKKSELENNLLSAIEEHGDDPDQG